MSLDSDTIEYPLFDFRDFNFPLKQNAIRHCISISEKFET